jgi:hypothetical protein
MCQGSIEILGGFGGENSCVIGNDRSCAFADWRRRVGMSLASGALWPDNWVCSKFPAGEPAEALAAALREREFTILGADPIVGPRIGRTVAAARLMGTQSNRKAIR